MPTKNVTVKVPQADGEITLRHNAEDPVTYKVTGNETSVPEEKVSLFLRVVEGAALANPPKEK